MHPLRPKHLLTGLSHRLGGDLQLAVLDQGPQRQGAGRVALVSDLLIFLLLAAIRLA
jgi:hypothetical protein